VSERQPSFLGSVLKAVVCTPNGGDDADAYQRDVVERVKEWRRLWESDTELTLDQKRDVLTHLVRIFEVKRVDAAEQRDRLKEIAELHGVTG
jgi:hypothetical protein